ncbi:Carbon-nitrogen hydrolase [Penicillium longicatenatum]|uniref:Carbon-nitrogen hydrolase n=1 Tax=Penicillium longicatenatum TaxID=1561947 RepID=UPI0025468184|nr:Carbon-nitrogen hydrolase [Penicillium longicatenatum]KAJ5649805.1 Carbon-nitrogen hydrolase [Penicillium longicatenatum]
MRIATLQFAPKLGDVESNIQRANEVLNRGKLLSLGSGRSLNPKAGLTAAIEIERLRPDVLVLPELALTGYNFPSLEAIKPYLEPAGTGRSATWARATAKRLKCKVCIGYPEIEIGNGTDPAKYYNSLLVVDEHGEVIHNYRKCFLYYTDETWAAEGNVERGFHELDFHSRDDAQRTSGDLVGDIHRGAAGGDKGDGEVVGSAPSSKKVATSFGICMDINPYKFEAPYAAYEFASRVLDSQSQLVILSMAWLSMHSREILDALNREPDMDTFSYWLQRFMPLLEKEMQHARNVDDEDTPKQVVIVFANRAGEEPAADDTKPPALYAGTSAVVAVTQRAGLGSREGVQAEKEMEVKILCWDQLGAQEEGICFADTTADPKMVFGLRRSE